MAAEPSAATDAAALSPGGKPAATAGAAISAAGAASVAPGAAITLPIAPLAQSPPKANSTATPSAAPPKPKPARKSCALFEPSQTEYVKIPPPAAGLAAAGRAGGKSDGDDSDGGNGGSRCGAKRRRHNFSKTGVTTYTTLDASQSQAAMPWLGGDGTGENVAMLMLIVASLW